MTIAAITIKHNTTNTPTTHAQLETLTTNQINDALDRTRVTSATTETLQDNTGHAQVTVILNGPNRNTITNELANASINTHITFKA